jgi:hypothetical protein
MTRMRYKTSLDPLTSFEDDEFLSSLYKYQMLGSVIGQRAALQHSPYAFVVCSPEGGLSSETTRRCVLRVSSRRYVRV